MEKSTSETHVRIFTIKQLMNNQGLRQRTLAKKPVFQKPPSRTFFKVR